MLSRVLLGVLLGVLVLAALAYGASLLWGPSDAECGPVAGTVRVADGDRPALARISEDDARAAALVAVPPAAVVEVDLDEEDGFLVYEVALRHDREEFDVVVDAGTGEVLCTERD